MMIEKFITVDDTPPSVPLGLGADQVPSGRERCFLRHDDRLVQVRPAAPRRLEQFNDADNGHRLVVGDVHSPAHRRFRRIVRIQGFGRTGADDHLGRPGGLVAVAPLDVAGRKVVAGDQVDPNLENNLDAARASHDLPDLDRLTADLSLTKIGATSTTAACCAPAASARQAP